MIEQMNSRMESLKAEFVRGQERLTQLEADSAQVRQTLLRISGAIQVLDELIVAESEQESAGGDPE
jgi:predicted nuclease with TOPRIM domain